MKPTKGMLAALGAASLALCSWSVSAKDEAAKMPDMKPAMMKSDVVWPADKIQWNAGPMEGVKVANLWGAMDQETDYGVLIKFRPGLMHPLHTHTESLKIVVLAGTFVHRTEGGVETRLGPGSYVLQRGGLKHVSGCAEGAECTFFMTSGAAFDLTPAEAPKGKSGK